MASPDVIHIERYHPPGVKEIINHGSICFIGYIDQGTVLKYPKLAADRHVVETEAKLLAIAGEHDRIIKSKGLTETGLRLERVTNGNLYDYICGNQQLSAAKRLSLCLQIVEGMGHLHQHSIFHCDLRPHNILMDQDFGVKVADVQGVHKSSSGATLLDGFSRESSKYYMPRKNADVVHSRTDIFAVGSTIHFVMMGQEVFPQIDGMGDGDDDIIYERFKLGNFPDDDHLLSQVTRKCWLGQYESALGIQKEIRAVKNPTVLDV